MMNSGRLAFRPTELCSNLHQAGAERRAPILSALSLQVAAWQRRVQTMRDGRVLLSSVAHPVTKDNSER